jgi:hypothetical protein
MARQITAGGITKVGLGAITQIHAEGLNQIGLSASGVLGLVGEADGGVPGATSGIVTVSDPARATELFKSGPLVDAIKVAFEPSGDPLVPGGAAQVLIYKTNASTQSKLFLPSDSTDAVSTTVSGGASTTTSIDVAATMVADEHIDRWVDITVASVSTTYRRRITDNTTTAITITPALPVAPAASDVVHIRSSLFEVMSRDYGLHTSTITFDLNYTSADDTHQVVTAFEGSTQISPLLGGITRNYLHVVYTGGTPDISTTITGSSSTVTLLNVAATLVASAHDNKTLVLRDSSGALKAISKITTNGVGSVTLAVALSEAPVTGDIVQILGVTNAVGTFSGASGVATSFATTITGVTGDNLSISLTSGMTLRQLQTAINLNTNYTATIPNGINGDTVLAQEFDFGTSVNIQRSFSGTVSTTGFRQNLNEVLDWINTNAQYISAVRATAGTTDGGQLNTSSYDPEFTLYGGTRGISTNSSFQDGLDAFLLKVVNQIVVCIDQDLVNEGYSSTATWDSVSQQLVDHVVHARGSAGVERGGVIGFRGSKSEIITAALSLNDADVQMVCQGVYMVDSTGTLVARGPRELAAMAAGMRLGVPEIGEPLTKKYLRTSGVIQLDSSWDPASVTDAADLVNAGVFFAQNVVGKGTRWNRDLTTWVKDDNLAYTDGSVRDVVRFIAYDFRTFLEDRFIGHKATPASISSIKSAATAKLELYRQDNLIVDSTDPATGVKVKAYHNLKVSSSGDVARVNVGIFPVPGLNFLLNDIYLSLPTQSA